MDCGVSIVTIEHAYSLLRDEDYCETRERSGCYVIYSPERSFPSGMISKKSFTKASGNTITQPDIPLSYAEQEYKCFTGTGYNRFRSRIPLRNMYTDVRERTYNSP